ncbi:aldehyde dehydrogenase [candidate division TA06 bacterium]|nr:aldehyde dehydrogenase [candidate division TA06 bacterium]
MTKFHIAGEFSDSKSGEVTEIRNPATGEVVDTVPKGTEEDARRAVDSAHEAFEEWSQTPPTTRGSFLYQGAQKVREAEGELSILLTQEQGKPKKEAILELRRFASTLEYYAGLGVSIRGSYIPLHDHNRYGMIIKRPIGVCGAIVPWNFPVSLMGNKIAPALVAGNTVVVKPASTTPLTSIRCIEILNKTGLPKGVLNIVTGPGAIVGEELLRNPKVRKIGFTGETETGKHVMSVAAQEIKRVTLELGGSDPLIVCEDADLDGAVKAAAVGRFFNCGQACLAIKRLYLFEKIADPFIEKLIERVKRLKIGNGLEEGTIIGPLHTQKQREEVESQVEDAQKSGAKVLTGGKRPTGSEFDKGFFYLPTLLSDVPDSGKIVQEECFGPALPIFRVKNLEEAIEKANSSIYGLGSSIWTQDFSKAHYAAERIEAGYTWINSIQTIYDELPFGGLKHSGLGKEHGIEALEHYLETKSIVIAT